MSVRPNLTKGRFATGVLIVLSLWFISSRALAQKESTPATPAATCSVEPSEVVVGEPVTATVTASHFNRKHTLTYVWTPSHGGGKVIGKDATVQIETTNAATGSYTVTVRVTDAKEKKNNEAICTSDFVVKPPPPKQPPTISISASSTSVPPGGTVNLSANCTSPDGSAVTFTTWTSAAGIVSGDGGLATLNTAGVPPGPIAVHVTCTDAHGLNAEGSTEITVENPPPPPPSPSPSPEIKVMEARLALNSIYFPTSLPPIEDPNAGLVASQRQTLVTLAADFKKYLETNPEAHLILEGHTDPRGRTEYDQKLSERRVDCVKSFMVAQGVSQASIDTKAFGALHMLTEARVKDAIEHDPQLSPEERQRALSDIQTIVLASDRRVDITLSTTGQSSVREFPFNAADALTLIGGRESEAKKTAPQRKTNKR